MKTQIRDAVFETNSSSSHSVTIDRSEVLDFGLLKEVLRDGVIRVNLSEDGYGWEWKRYFRPENKIAYMLTQFAGGHLPMGASELAHDADHAALFREDNRCDWFLSTIEKATGCRVEITREDSEADWGYSIDHQSVGRDIEEISEEDDILRLVFGTGSYVETGNDNSSPPEKIETDGRGYVQYFERVLVGSLPEGIQFRLREMDGEGWNKRIEIRTPSDGCQSTSDVTWSFRSELRDILREGKTVISGFSVTLPFHQNAPDAQIAAFARKTALERWIELLREPGEIRVLRHFEVDFHLKPYLKREGSFKAVPDLWDFASQAEVTLLGVADDVTMARVRDLFSRAADYAPARKEPSA